MLKSARSPAGSTQSRVAENWAGRDDQGKLPLGEDFTTKGPRHQVSEKQNPHWTRRTDSLSLMVV